MSIAPLAHAGHGFGQLGVPLTTVLYGVALLLVVAFLAARAVRPTPADGDPTERILVSGAPAVAAGGLVAGLLLVVAVVDVVAALGAPNRPLVNPAPWATFVLFIGLQVASLLVGSAWWPVSPVTTLARLARAGAPRRPAPVGPVAELTAPVLLGLVAWLLVAYHAPFSPRVHGGLLIALAVGLVVGSVVWGRRWLRHAEPLGALADVAGAVAPLHVRGRSLRARLPLVGLRSLPADRRTVGVALVLATSAVYEALSERAWWLEVLGTTRGWTRTAWQTLGLLWVGLLVGVTFEAAARVTARLAGDVERRSLRDDVTTLVPLALGYSVANWFSYLVTDAGQGLVRLASDPFDLGWDLFGTDLRPVDYGILSASTFGWIEVTFVTLGGVGALLAAHDLVVRRYAVRAARRAEWAYLVTIAVLTLAGIWSLLGA